jgi:cyclophilin family peptidyl-prolyl cis-trans isomerase
MQRKNIIVLLTSNEEPVVRGNFKKLCDEFGFPYHSLKMKEFPIYYKESIIHKVEFK